MWADDKIHDASPAESGLDYLPRIQGVDGDLRQKLTDSLSLMRLRDRKPSSLAALRARLDADLEVVEKILKSESYYGFRVDHQIDATQQPVLAEITIDPGPAYKLAKFEIAYLDHAPGTTLPPELDKIGITLGDPAHAAAIVDAQSHLIGLLGEQGYPYAVVENRKVLVHHDSQTVTVALDLRTGPKTTLGPVTIKGNERTGTDYILRLADLKTGETFSLSKLDDARRRLFGTGLFDTVAITWPQSYPGQPQLPVTIDVKERDRRTIALGAFYSTTEGVGVEASWTNRNIFGQGERLELGARVAERQLATYADFLMPNFGRTDQNLTARADAKRLQTDAYDQTGISSTVGLQRQLNSLWRGSLAAAVEASRIREVGESEEEYVIFGFPGQLAYDGADDLFDPSKGFRLTLDLSPNQVTGDSDDRFLLAAIGGTAYQEVWPDKRVILAARARVASLMGADIESIPASRRLYSGGGGSIRGYAYQSVGPLDDNNKPTGGRSLVEMSVEARIRITDTIGIVPFIDAGTASDSITPTTEAMQWAAGLGLRYYTAIGPLRFDIARPLNRRENVDDQFAIYVSLGQAF